MSDNDEILTEKEAAAFLKIAPQSLRCQRAGHVKPNGMPMIPWVKFGRNVRYVKSDLVAFAQAHRHGDAA